MSELDAVLGEVRDHLTFLERNQHHASQLVLSLLGRVLDLLTQTCRRLADDIEGEGLKPIGTSTVLVEQGEHLDPAEYAFLMAKKAQRDGKSNA